MRKWMDAYELSAKHNLAETCSASISLNDLLALAPKSDLIDYSQKQTYGAIRGTEALRTNIASLYSTAGSQPGPVSANGILVTNGAIQANFLALYASVGPGDHVICQYPTYQQLYSVPQSFGAEVSLWRSEESNGWRMDLKELKASVKSNTKMIILKYVHVFDPWAVPVPLFNELISESATPKTQRGRSLDMKSCRGLSILRASMVLLSIPMKFIDHYFTPWTLDRILLPRFSSSDMITSLHHARCPRLLASRESAWAGSLPQTPRSLRLVLPLAITL